DDAARECGHELQARHAEAGPEPAVRGSSETAEGRGGSDLELAAEHAGADAAAASRAAAARTGSSACSRRAAPVADEQALRFAVGTTAAGPGGSGPGRTERRGRAPQHAS